MTSRLIGATALAGAALLLPACDSTSETQTTVTVTEPAPAAETTAAEPAATPSPGEQTPSPGDAPARPARDQCVRIDPAPDGRYQVFDAGSAVVTFADGRLTLESVTPADGWTHQVDEQDPDEVEIEFRRNAEQLDLELDVDDGRLKVKICNDDD